MLLINSCTYLVIVNMYHFLVFHLLIKSTLHLSLLHHLKLLLNLCTCHYWTCQIQSRSASWFLRSWLMTVLCVFAAVDATLSHCVLLWLEIANEPAARLSRISHLEVWQVVIFPVGSDSRSAALSCGCDWFARHFKPRLILPRAATDSSASILNRWMRGVVSDVRLRSILVLCRRGFVWN